jgi:LPXTG-motif cell wall-anchored protein
VIRKLAILLGMVLALALSGGASAQDSVTVALNPINNSGISGSAVFTPVGNQTQVVVTINGEPTGGSEPIHIHTGQCGATLGGVKFPLKNVENGMSTTVVDTPFVPLWSGGFAINAHESAANIKNYVACGNLPAMATALPATGGVDPSLITLVAAALLTAGYVLRRRTAQGAQLTTTNRTWIQPTFPWGS